MKTDLSLRQFTAADLPAIRPWFDDPDTLRYLGGPEWPEQMLALGVSQIGTKFRGARQLAAHRWIAYTAGNPVGYIDCGIFDRWTTCGPSGEDIVVVSAIERRSAAMAYVVAPHARKRGIGRAMIATMLDTPELADVEIACAGVEPANLASIRCLLSLGFQYLNADSDWEGIVYLMKEINPAPQ